MAKERKGFGPWSKNGLKPFALRLTQLTDEWIAANQKPNGKPASQTDCAKAAGHDDGKWSRWISAESEPGLLDMIGVAEFFGVPFGWLAAGEGRLSKPAENAPSQSAKSAATALGFGQKAIDAGLADAKADDDAWAILVRIELADRNAKASPANQAKSSGDKEADAAGIVSDFGAAMDRIGAENRKRGAK